MAANMNKREHFSAVCTVIFVLFSLFFGLASSSTTASTDLNTTSPQAATTPAVDSNANSTTPNATVTPTEVVTTTTTTTPAPTTTPLSIAQANVDVVGQCPCDVTGNACDVLCCCDEDCSAEDKLAYCLHYSKRVGEKLCFPKELFLFENFDKVTSQTEGDQLCIYPDDGGNSDAYTQPDLVESLSAFQEYQAEFSSFSFQSPDPPAPEVSQDSVYMSGSPIYTVSPTEALGVLGLPRPLTSNNCVDNNPAAYLLDQTFSCERHIRSVSSECDSAPSLDAQSFFTGFRVVASPSLFQEMNSTLTDTEGFSLYNSTSTVEVKLDERDADTPPIQCLNSSTGDITPCYNASLPSPSLQGGVCQDVLSQVHYIVITDGPEGIFNVYARFVLTSVPEGERVSLKQTFSAHFEPRSAPGNALPLSGNPGYVVGQPLLAGTLNQTTDASGNTVDRIVLSTDRGRYMTVAKSSATGDCGGAGGSDDDDDRSSVLFGQDVRTGCLLRVRGDNLTDFCRRTQESVIDVLEWDSRPEATDSGYRDNNRYVGLYGNSDPSQTGDWVKILYQYRPLPRPPTPLTSSCPLSLSVQITVMFARIGAIVNPQPKVIGVTFTYDDPKDVQVKVSETGEVNQAVMISASVSFLDVSKEAATYEARPSIYDAKVPDDFFYPFVTGSAGSIHHQGALLLPPLVTVWATTGISIIMGIKSLIIRG